MLDVVFNADDFGVSPGVNQAIIAAHRQGVLNSASIMMNAPYVDEAIALARDNPGLRLGIHLNLTAQRNQRPLSPLETIPLLVNAGGLLRHGFCSLLALSLLRGRALREQAEREMRAQIDLALSRGITPSHLDSHRHVHMIPALFATTLRLRDAYRIPRVRDVNESLRATWRGVGAGSALLTGGLLKYFVLKTFSRLNRAPRNAYFYSIIHTTRLFGANVGAILVPEGYASVEVCLHPSLPEVDRESADPSFADYLLASPDRRKEFEALLDAGFPARIRRLR